MQIKDQIAIDGTTSRGNPWVIAFTFVSAWLCLLFLNTAVAQEPRKAGKAGGIRVTLDWGDVPLRERLTEFGKKYGVSVFLDRRVDPDQKIELSARDLPVEGVLALAAENLKLGTCTIGKVHSVRFGAALPFWEENVIPGTVPEAWVRAEMEMGLT